MSSSLFFIIDTLCFCCCFVVVFFIFGWFIFVSLFSWVVLEFLRARFKVYS